MDSPVCIILSANMSAKPRVITDRGGVIAAEVRLSALLKTVVEKGGTMSSFWKRCAGAALVAAVGGSVASSVAGAQTGPITLSPITLSVDLTDAPRKILQATQVL